MGKLRCLWNLQGREGGEREKERERERERDVVLWILLGAKRS